MTPRGRRQLLYRIDRVHLNSVEALSLVHASLYNSSCPHYEQPGSRDATTNATVSRRCGCGPTDEAVLMALLAGNAGVPYDPSLPDVGGAVHVRDLRYWRVFHRLPAC